MTYDEFIQKLRETPRHLWALDDGAIRFHRDHCPLSMLAGTEPCSVSDSIRVLGIDADLADAIVAAADDTWVHDDERAIRDDILHACGLLGG